MILLSTRPLARHRTFRRLGAIHADILLVRWSTRSRRTKRGVVSHASRRTCKASWIEDRHYSRSAKRSTTLEENDLADRGTLTYMCMRSCGINQAVWSSLTCLSMRPLMMTRSVIVYPFTSILLSERHVLLPSYID